MKSRTLMFVIAMTLLAALAVPLRLAAQEQQTPVYRQGSAGKNSDNEQSAVTGPGSLPLEAQASISAQLAKLTASDGAAFDYLAYSVAISGGTVVVGAPIVTIGSNRVQGAAYVFVKQGTDWTNMTQTAKLTASDGAFRDNFGCSVSISGNTVAVGAFAAGVGSNAGQGAAYVFVKPASGWADMTQTAKLPTASYGAAGDLRRWSVSVSGNTVVAGAVQQSFGPGAAYVFVKPVSGWTDTTETAKLTASDGALDDQLGWALSTDGSTVVSGAHTATTSGVIQLQGAAYVFVRPASGWANMTQTAKLTASNASYADYLGSSVSISGNTIAAGAPGSGAGRGGAYVFVKPVGGWANMTETAELTGGLQGDLLGFSLAISGNTIVAGAPRWPARDVRGAAYVFVKPATGWKSTSSFSARLTASDGAANDYFGYSVSIDGNTIVPGAYGATIRFNSQQGAAYVFGDSHLFAAAIPVQLASAEPQQGKKEKNTRYTLTDLGTFGGPQSFLNISAQVLNDQGVVTGYADTSTPDPLCYFDDCFYPNAFQWQDDVLTNLGALPGSQWSTTLWISGNGLIAGWSENGETDPLTGFPELRGVLWSGGQITDLGTLEGGYESLATAVNNERQVVGFETNTIPDPFCSPFFLCPTQTRAFLWQNGVNQDLGTLGGPDALAALVNDHGQIAGNSYTSYIPNPLTGVPQIDPFLWQDGRMIDLGSLGGPTGFANYLNNRGQVVGQMDLPAVFHPFLWDRGTLTDLGSFPGAGFYGSASWINEAGDTVGWADNNIDDFPALWEHGMIRNLGTVGGDTCGYANAINSKGQIVGKSGPCLGVAAHAFLWEPGGPVVDLNTLVHSASGAHLNIALFINERGEIAAQGLLPNGDQHAFLLTPCGEGDEGCGEGGGESAVLPSNPATHADPSGTLPQSLLRRMNRYRFPGLAFGPRN